MLPVSDGVWVEYLFGDWQWAALDRTGAASAVRSAVWSTQATLGRRYLYDPRPLAVPQPLSPVEVQTGITVDRDRCRRLQLELDRRWRTHARTAVDPGPVGNRYLFVPDDEPYGLLHNCNRETADWLDRLGCRTGGLPILSHFAVGPPG